jgi:hypothetical protein
MFFDLRQLYVGVALLGILEVALVIVHAAAR